MTSFDFDHTKDMIVKLLNARTYDELQDIKQEEFKPVGIEIGEDLILTERRKIALRNIKEQFANQEDQVVILTGYFGAGKTALLNALARQIASGEIKYGATALYPIHIKLHEQATTSTFIDEVLRQLSDRSSEEWVVQVYQRVRRDWLPADHWLDSPVISLQHIRQELKDVPLACIDEVRVCLDNLFAALAQDSTHRIMIALIIDELENFQDTKRLEDWEHNHLLRLLMKIFDLSIRTKRTMPYLLLFATPMFDDLKDGGWIRGDDQIERALAVKQEINLPAGEATELITGMVKLYLKAVLEVAAEHTNDNDIRKWARNVHRREGSIYPIDKSILTFIERKLLALGENESVRSFRAYQVAVKELIRCWNGKGQIDFGFLWRHGEDLRRELSSHPGAIVNNIPERQQLQDIIASKCPDLSSLQRTMLSRIAEHAILVKTDKTPSINIAEGQQVDFGDILVSDESLRQIFEDVQALGENDLFEVVGDYITVHVQELLSAARKGRGQGRGLSEEVKQLRDAVLEIEGVEKSIDSWSVQEVLKEYYRNQSKFTLTSIDGDLLTITGPASYMPHYIGRYYLSFDTDSKQLKTKVKQEVGCSPAMLFSAPGRNQTLPFSMTLILPEPLAKYADKLHDDVLQVVKKDAKFMNVVNEVARQKKAKPYEAFKTAVKFWLWIRMGQSRVTEFVAVRFDISSLLVTEISLGQSWQSEWARERTGIDLKVNATEFCRLTKVIAWMIKEQKASILYNNVEEVVEATSNIPLAKARTSIHLPISKDWASFAAKKIIQSDLFQENGELSDFEDWPSTLRKRIRNLRSEMKKRGVSLSFKDTLEQIFGDNVRISPTGKAYLHLLLILGEHEKAQQWHIKNAEKIDAIEIAEGTVDFQQIRHTAMLKILSNAIGYYLAKEDQEERERLAANIEALVKRLPDLKKSADYAILKDIEKVVSDTPEPELSATAVDMREFAIPEEDPCKVGEYLVNLSRLLPQDTLLAYAISPVVDHLKTLLTIDLSAIQLVDQFNDLRAKWGRKGKPKTTRGNLLVNIQRLNETLRREEAWTTIARSFRDGLTERVARRLKGQDIEQELASICRFVDRQVKKIVNPDWKGRYSDDDLAQLERAKTKLEESIMKEIDRLLRKIVKCQTDAQTVSETDELANVLALLEKGKEALEQRKSDLYLASSAGFVARIQQHITDCQSLVAQIKLTERKEIDSWIQKEGLQEIQPLVEKWLPAVRGDFDTVVETLKRKRVNAVAILRQPSNSPRKKLDQLLALFAAKKLDEHLRST